MKLIIAGGRHHNFSKEDMDKLDLLESAVHIEEVVSGGCPTGADNWGEVWADSKNIPTKIFKADWSKHGKAAGPLRNKAMAEYADGVVLFPGGKGTESMLKEAKKAGIKVVNFHTKQETNKIL
jgi:hypothetical protein